MPELRIVAAMLWVGFHGSVIIHVIAGKTHSGEWGWYNVVLCLINSGAVTLAGAILICGKHKGGSK